MPSFAWGDEVLQNNLEAGGVTLPTAADISSSSDTGANATDESAESGNKDSADSSSSGKNGGSSTQGLNASADSDDDDSATTGEGTSSSAKSGLSAQGDENGGLTPQTDDNGDGTYTWYYTPYTEYVSENDGDTYILYGSDTDVTQVTYDSTSKFGTILSTSDGSILSSSSTYVATGDESLLVLDVSDTPFWMLGYTLTAFLGIIPQDIYVDAGMGDQDGWVSDMSQQVYNTGTALVDSNLLSGDMDTAVAGQASVTGAWTKTSYCIVFLDALGTTTGYKLSQLNWDSEVPYFGDAMTGDIVTDVAYNSSIIKPAYQNNAVWWVTADGNHAAQFLSGSPTHFWEFLADGTGSVPASLNSDPQYTGSFHKDGALGHISVTPNFMLKYKDTSGGSASVAARVSSSSTSTPDATVTSLTSSASELGGLNLTGMTAWTIPTTSGGKVTITPGDTLTISADSSGNVTVNGSAIVLDGNKIPLTASSDTPPAATTDDYRVDFSSDPAAASATISLNGATGAATPTWWVAENESLNSANNTGTGTRSGGALSALTSLSESHSAAYEFDGWDLDIGGTVTSFDVATYGSQSAATTALLSASITGDATVTAKYVPAVTTYDVSFAAPTTPSGAGTPAPSTALTGITSTDMPIDAYPAATLSVTDISGNYIFTGWELSEDGGSTYVALDNSKYDDTTNPSILNEPLYYTGGVDVTFRPVYTEAYAVTLAANPSSGVGGTITTVNPDDGVSTPSQTNIVRYVTPGSKLSTASGTNVYAFDSTAGNHVAAPISSATAVAASGYGFTGWTAGGSAVTDPVNETITGPITFTANFGAEYPISWTSGTGVTSLSGGSTSWLAGDATSTLTTPTITATSGYDDTTPTYTISWGGSTQGTVTVGSGGVTTANAGDAIRDIVKNATGNITIEVSLPALTNIGYTIVKHFELADYPSGTTSNAVATAYSSSVVSEAGAQTGSVGDTITLTAAELALPAAGTSGLPTGYAVANYTGTTNSGITNNTGNANLQRTMMGLAALDTDVKVTLSDASAANNVVHIYYTLNTYTLNIEYASTESPVLKQVGTAPSSLTALGGTKRVGQTIAAFPTPINKNNPSNTSAVDPEWEGANTATGNAPTVKGADSTTYSATGFTMPAQDVTATYTWIPVTRAITYAVGTMSGGSTTITETTSTNPGNSVTITDRVDTTDTSLTTSTITDQAGTFTSEEYYGEQHDSGLHDTSHYTSGTISYTTTPASNWQFKGWYKSTRTTPTGSWSTPTSISGNPTGETITAYTKFIAVFEKIPVTTSYGLSGSTTGSDGAGGSDARGTNDFTGTGTLTSTSGSAEAGTQVTLPGYTPNSTSNNDDIYKPSTTASPTGTWYVNNGGTWVAVTDEDTSTPGIQVTVTDTKKDFVFVPELQKYTVTFPTAGVNCTLTSALTYEGYYGQPLTTYTSTADGSAYSDTAVAYTPTAGQTLDQNGWDMSTDGTNWTNLGTSGGAFVAPGSQTITQDTWFRENYTAGAVTYYVQRYYQDAPTSIGATPTYTAEGSPVAISTATVGSTVTYNDMVTAGLSTARPSGEPAADTSAFSTVTNPAYASYGAQSNGAAAGTSLNDFTSFTGANPSLTITDVVSGNPSNNVINLYYDRPSGLSITYNWVDTDSTNTSLADLATNTTFVTTSDRPLPTNQSGTVTVGTTIELPYYNSTGTTLSTGTETIPAGLPGGVGGTNYVHFLGWKVTQNGTDTVILASNVASNHQVTITADTVIKGYWYRDNIDVVFQNSTLGSSNATFSSIAGLTTQTMKYGENVIKTDGTNDVDDAITVNAGSPYFFQGWINADQTAAGTVTTISLPKALNTTNFTFTSGGTVSGSVATVNLYAAFGNGNQVKYVRGDYANPSSASDGKTGTTVTVGLWNETNHTHSVPPTTAAADMPLYDTDNTPDTGDYLTGYTFLGWTWPQGTTNYITNSAGYVPGGTPTGYTWSATLPDGSANRDLTALWKPVDQSVTFLAWGTKTGNDYQGDPLVANESSIKIDSGYTALDVTLSASGMPTTVQPDTWYTLPTSSELKRTGYTLVGYEFMENATQLGDSARVAADGTTPLNTHFDGTVTGSEITSANPWKVYVGSPTSCTIVPIWSHDSYDVDFTYAGDSGDSIAALTGNYSSFTIGGSNANAGTTMDVDALDATGRAFGDTMNIADSNGAGSYVGVPIVGDVATGTVGGTSYSYTFVGWSTDDSTTPTTVTDGTAASPVNTYTVPAKNLVITGTWKITEYQVDYAAAMDTTLIDSSDTTTASVSGTTSEQVDHNGNPTMTGLVTSTSNPGYAIDHWTISTYDGTTWSAETPISGSPTAEAITAPTKFTAYYGPSSTIDYTVKVHVQVADAAGNLTYKDSTQTYSNGVVGTQMKIGDEAFAQARTIQNTEFGTSGWNVSSYFDNTLTDADFTSTTPTMPDGYADPRTNSKIEFPDGSHPTSFVTPTITATTSTNVVEIWFDLVPVQYQIVRYYQSADGTAALMDAANPGANDGTADAGVVDTTDGASAYATNGTSTYYADGYAFQPVSLTGAKAEAKDSSDATAASSWTKAANITADDKTAAGSVAPTSLWTMGTPSVVDGGVVMAGGGITGDGASVICVPYTRPTFEITFKPTLATGVSANPYPTIPIDNGSTTSFYTDKARWGAPFAAGTANGGNVNYSSSSTPVGEGGLPLKSGYNAGSYYFSGWSDAATTDKVTVTSANYIQVMPARAVTLTGEWAFQQYTVTYAASPSDATGVSVKTTSPYSATELVSQGGTPTKASYGDTSQDGTNDYEIDSWTFVGSVTFPGDSSPTTVTSETSMSGKSPTDVTINGDTTFYATWKLKEYKVTYAIDNTSAYSWSSGGAPFTASETAEYTGIASGTTLGTAQIPDWSTTTTGAGMTNAVPKAGSGYQFVGWTWTTSDGTTYATSDGDDTTTSTAEQNFINLMGTSTAKAAYDPSSASATSQWAAVLAKITFGRGTGNQSADITFTTVTKQLKFSVEYRVPDSPNSSSTTWTQLGTADGVTQGSGFDRDLTYTDKIFANSITSTVYTNGVSKPGYTFDGWYNSADYTTTKITEVSKPHATTTVEDIVNLGTTGVGSTGGIIKLYAKYTPKTLDITYIDSLNTANTYTDNGSAIVTGASYNVLDKATTGAATWETDSTHAGRVFVGWTKTNIGDLTDAYIAAFGDPSHVSASGEVMDYAVNDVYTIQPDPSDDSTSSGNTFYAVWKPVEYNIQFSSGTIPYTPAVGNEIYNATNTPGTENYNIDSITDIGYTTGITLDAIPAPLTAAGAAAGKSFAGWNVSLGTAGTTANVQVGGATQTITGATLASIIQAASPTWRITDGTTFTLTAIWSDELAVNYHANANDAKIQVGTATPQTVADIIAGGGTDVVFSENIMKNESSGSYTMDVHNGSNNTTYGLYDESTGTAVGITMTRPGYVFKGWDTNASATNPTYSAAGVADTAYINTARTITGNTDLYAIWEPAAAQDVNVEEYLMLADGTYQTNPDNTVPIEKESDGSTALKTATSYTVAPSASNTTEYTASSVVTSDYSLDTAQNADWTKTLAGSGTTFKVYYKRNTHTVTYEYGNLGTLSGLTNPAFLTDTGGIAGDNTYRTGQTVKALDMPTEADITAYYAGKGLDVYDLPTGTALVWVDTDTGATTLGNVAGLSPFTMPDRDVTLRLELVRHPFTVTYVADTNGFLTAGGQKASAGTVVYQETVRAFDKPTLVLDAGSTIGGVDVSGQTVSATGDTAATGSASDFAFTNWTWTGYDSATKYSTNPATSADAIILQDTLLTANFDEIFTVTYNNDNVGDDFTPAKVYQNLRVSDTIPYPGTSVTGSASATETTPKHKTGYTFVGWHVTNTDRVDSSYAPVTPDPYYYTTWALDPDGGTAAEVAAGTKKYEIISMSDLYNMNVLGNFTLDSVYDAEKFDAEFDANGGTITSDGTAVSSSATLTRGTGDTKVTWNDGVGNSLSSQPVAARTGFKLTGWELVEENGAAPAAAKTFTTTEVITMRYGGMKLKAVWEPADATYTYVVDSASLTPEARGTVAMNLASVSNPETVHNDGVTAPTSPTGAYALPNYGYEFEKWTSASYPAKDLETDGWSTASGLVMGAQSIIPQKVTVTTDPATSTTVQAYESDTFSAHFVPKNYTVEFLPDLAGLATVGGLATTQTVAYKGYPVAMTGSSANYEVTSVATGYEQDGGKWEYTIQIGDASMSGLATAAETWHADTKTITGETTDPSTIAIRGNTTFRPVIKASVHTLTYDYDISTSPDVVKNNVATGTVDTVPEIQATDIPDGYTFGGWKYTDPSTGAVTIYNANDTDTTNDTFTMPGSDATLVAVWVGKTITITYVCNGGSGNANNGETPAGQTSYTQTYTYGSGSGTSMDDDTFTPSPGTNSHGVVPPYAREFDKWASNANGTGSIQVGANSSFTLPTEDTTLYAIYKNRQYTVTLDRNMGTDGACTTTTATYSTSGVWQYETPLPTYEYGDTLTLPYIFDYDSFGNIETDSNGKNLYDFWNPPSSNYSFLHWSDSATGSGATGSYKGLWNNGITVTVGSDPVFKSVQDSASTPSVDESVAKEDVTLYVNWDYDNMSGEGYYVVYYNEDGANLLDSTGTGAEVYATPTNYGAFASDQNIYRSRADKTLSGHPYAFKGWAEYDPSDPNANAQGAVCDASGTPILVAAGNTTLASAVAAASETLNVSVTNGLTSATGTDGNSYTIPARPLRLVEVYELADYTVKFDPNLPVGTTIYSGSCPDQDFTWGTPEDLNKNIYSVNGYTFLGWSKNPLASAPDANLSAPSGVVSYNTGTHGELTSYSGPAEVTLYAVWSEVDNYKVRYIADYDPSDTTGASDVVHATDQYFKWTENPTAITTIPSKSVGTDTSTYTFEGWYTAKDGGGVKIEDADTSGKWDKTIQEIAASSDNYAAYNAQSDKSYVYLYAKWTKTGWSVNYQVAPGTDPKPVGDANRAEKKISAASNVDITSPSTSFVTYDGFTPDGWVIDTDADGSFDFSFDSAGNYNGTDTYVPSSGVVAYNDPAIQSALASALYSGTRTLEARVVYKEMEYTVNYNLNTGSDPAGRYSYPQNTVSTPLGDVIQKTGLDWNTDTYIGASYDVGPTRDGYTFDGWFAGNGSVAFNYPAIYGYNANKSTWTVKQLADLQAALKGSGTGKYTTTSYDLYAKWIENSNYTVKYDLKGGSIAAVAGNQFLGTDETPLKWTDNATAAGYTLVPGDYDVDRSGYTFDGWWLTSDYKAGSQLTSGATMSYGDLAEALKAVDAASGAAAIADGGTVTIYAKWKEVTTPINYAVDDTAHAQLYDGATASGTAVSGVTQLVGGATGAGLSPVTAMPLTGYKIVGWKATVVGAASEETYTVGTSSDNNPSGVLTENSDGSWTLDLSKMASVGNLNGGWVSATYTALTEAEDVNYTVQFYKQLPDGTYAAVPDETETRTATTGSTVTYSTSSPDDVNRYIADGYMLNTGVTGTIASATVAGDGTTVLKLYYETSPFTVTYQFSSDPDECPSPAPTITNPIQSVAPGGTHTLRTDTPATVFGWTFDGWDYAHVTVDYTPAGTSTALTLPNDAWNATHTSFTMPKGNVVVTGKWTREKQPVTYNKDVKIDPSVSGPISPTPEVQVNGASMSGTSYIQYVPTDLYPSLSDANYDGTANDPITVVNPDPTRYVVMWEYEYTDGPDKGVTGTTMDPESIQVTGPLTFTAVLVQKQIISYLRGTGVNGETVGDWTDVSKAYSATDSSTLSGATRYVAVPSPFSVNGTDYQYGAETVWQSDIGMYVPAHIEGYLFTGWVWENLDTGDTGTITGTSKTNVSTPFTNSSVTFTAQWTPTKQTLIFDTNGGSWTTGSTDPSGEYATGTHVGIPNNATATAEKDGYQLAGWKLDGDESGYIYPSGGTFTMPGHNAKLIAVWEPVPVTIKYEPNDPLFGSVLPTSETVISTSTNVLGSTPTANTGYHFVNWTMKDGSTLLGTVDATTNKITPTHNADGVFVDGVTYVANFEPNEYQVNFVSATGGYIDTSNPYVNVQTVKYNDTADKTIVNAVSNNPAEIVPKSPYPWSYEMWPVQADGSIATTPVTGWVYEVDDLAILGPTTFTAQWDAYGTYFVEYNTHGGTPLNRKAVLALTDTNLLPSASTVRPGYTFVRWDYQTQLTPSAMTDDQVYDDPSFWEEALNTYTFQKMNLPDSTPNVLTLHARWQERSDYQVIYDDGDIDGTDLPAYVMNYGWTYDQPSQTISNVAWTNDKFADGKNACAVDVPTKAGYTFDGWQVKLGDGTLSVDANGDPVYATIGMTYEDLVGIAYPDNPNADPSSITLVAHWTPKTYTLVYYDVDADTPTPVATHTETVTWDTPVYATYTPTDGTTRQFDRYDFNPSNLTDTNAGTMTTNVATTATYGDLAVDDTNNEVHVYAKWLKLIPVYDEYHLLNYNGTTYVDSYNAATAEADGYLVTRRMVEGTTAYATTLPSFAGYTYAGDTFDESGYKTGITPTSSYGTLGINDGVTLSGTAAEPHFVRYWKENTNYIVEYNGNADDPVNLAKGSAVVPSSVNPGYTPGTNGATTVPDQTVQSWTSVDHVDSWVDTYVTPERTGFDFIGWNTAADGSGTVDGVTEGNADDTNQYGDLTYAKDADGNWVKVDPLSSSSTVKLDSAGEYRGYTTLYAQWAQKRSHIIYRVNGDSDGTGAGSYGGMIRFNKSETASDLSVTQREEFITSVDGEEYDNTQSALTYTGNSMEGAQAVALPGWHFVNWTVNYEISDALADDAADDVQFVQPQRPVGNEQLELSPTMESNGGTVPSGMITQSAGMTTQATTIANGAEYSTETAILPGVGTNSSLYITAVYTANFEKNDDGIIHYDENPPLKPGTTEKQKVYNGPVPDTVAPWGSSVNLSDGTGEKGSVLTTAGFEIIGWDKEPHDPSDADYPSTPDYWLEEGVTMPQGETTLYAHWAPKKYSVSTENPPTGGTVIGGTDPLPYGTYIPEGWITVTPEDGYEPTGWVVEWIDPETGEKHTYTTYDPDYTKIPIWGETTLTPIFKYTGTKGGEETTTTTTVVTTTYGRGGGLPKTGDEETTYPFIIAMLAAMGLMALAAAKRRREEDDDPTTPGGSGNGASPKGPGAMFAVGGGTPTPMAAAGAAVAKPQTIPNPLDGASEAMGEVVQGAKERAARMAEAVRERRDALRDARERAAERKAQAKRMTADSVARPVGVANPAAGLADRISAAAERMADRMSAAAAGGKRAADETDRFRAMLSAGYEATAPVAPQMAVYEEDSFADYAGDVACAPVGAAVTQPSVHHYGMKSLR
ncbi:LPXTG cell wall anchor domain-containing protein [Denitrobacterium detoxificans]|uniref:LPXTG cell wall anchor domain-containing protein n=1 Tax=Denitrobacterium detoxificans TaxID=79604 RepID=UPI001160D012|nr:LPXTG cell wall anchor domain-containing protein [Denitrobacterium detoxificans]